MARKLTDIRLPAEDKHLPADGAMPSPMGLPVLEKGELMGEIIEAAGPDESGFFTATVRLDRLPVWLDDPSVTPRFGLWGNMRFDPKTRRVETITRLDSVNLFPVIAEAVDE